MSANKLTEELEQLHKEITSALSGSGEQILEASRARLEDLSKQLRTALNDLGGNLAQQERQAERIISDRPLVTLASALALGVAIGLVLRRA